MKQTEKKQQCSVQVSPNDPWGVFHQHHCTRAAIVEQDGKWYCKVHDPEYIKVKDAKRNNEWQEKFNREIAGKIAQDQCAKINPENPKVVAESIVDIYEALRTANKLLTAASASGSVRFAISDLNKIDKALTKAKGKANE